MLKIIDFLKNKIMKLVCNIKNSQTIMKETYVVMHLPTLMCNGIHNKIVGTKK